MKRPSPFAYRVSPYRVFTQICHKQRLARRAAGCHNQSLMHEGSITVRLSADLREVDRLNRVIRQFGDLHEVPSRVLYAVNLALDEVVTNVVRHGFDDAKDQEVVARLSVVAGEVSTEVSDGGRAFNPLEAAPPNLDAPLSERTLGGLGIHLVRSLMDSVEYRRDGGKNVLTLRKRIR
ncbi:MAG TPA: ATP-binding protein [Chthoniobacter sp.]|nr:ATP-binding protein [Chthoniobacter sp.]